METLQKTNLGNPKGDKMDKEKERMFAQFYIAATAGILKGLINGRGREQPEAFVDAAYEHAIYAFRSPQDYLWWYGNLTINDLELAKALLSHLGKINGDLDINWSKFPAAKSEITRIAESRAKL